MKFAADLHIHSKYSRATSPKMDIKTLSEFAKLKGISLMGTGDFTHHLWLEELKDILKDSGNGLFEYNGVNFMLTAEISGIYSKGGKVRKIHNVIFAPGFTVADKINSALSGYGNLASDGRPIIGIDAKELAEVLFGISRDIVIVPGHIWTPWFSLFGSKSGFDSIEECFEEYAKDIFALETGLSCYDEKTEILTKEFNFNGKKATLKDHVGSLINEMEREEANKEKVFELYGEFEELLKNQQFKIPPSLMVASTDGISGGQKRHGQHIREVQKGMAEDRRTGSSLDNQLKYIKDLEKMLHEMEAEIDLFTCENLSSLEISNLKKSRPGEYYISEGWGNRLLSVLGKYRKALNEFKTAVEDYNIGVNKHNNTIKEDEKTHFKIKR